MESSARRTRSGIGRRLKRRVRTLRARMRGPAALRQLSEHSSDVIFRFGADGRLRYVSPSVRNLYGVTDEILYGGVGTIHDNNFNHPADWPVIRETIERQLRGELDHSKVEFRIRAQDGGWTWVQTNCFAVRARRGGKVTDLIFIMRDVNDRKLLEQELERRATTDGLTGMPNRLAFDEWWAEAWKDASATGRPLSLLMIDIDHFKAYNDTHGHLAGDERLRAVSDAITDALPASSRLARYGGEEFALLMPGCGIDVAMGAAETVRRAVENLTPARDLDQPPRKVTVSIGVACREPQTLDGDGRAILLAEADRALYAAKRQGRNRVVLVGPEERAIPRLGAYHSPG